MKNNKYQAGVIGLRMGNAHCIGYRSNPYCELAAICDPDEDILKARKAEYNPRIATTNYVDIINDPEIDIVSVASPDFFHAEQCIAALKANKHVMCEKPLTLDLEEAKQIVEATKTSKGKFMIGQVCRYAPGFILAKRLIDDGAIGELYFAESEYAHNYDRAKGVGNWRIDPRREPFIGGGCHAVDLLRWIVGETRQVSAFANHKCLKDWPVNDCTVAIYKFDRDIIGKVMVSIGCIRPYTMRSCFYGTEGTIICDNTSPDIKICSKKFMSGKLDFATLPVNIANHNVSAEINDFLDCIVNDKPVATSVYEGARTVAAALAAAKSASLGGQPIDIEVI
ncbi:MAG: Gfo/Idh/MocA family oxidoreductase [Lentisphaerae bacterium]|jgi:predicted dehydrogenase|nr:Gfo/Idh/MocA family oxidoreductase [Lentisphaerota bacterium]